MLVHWCHGCGKFPQRKGVAAVSAETRVKTAETLAERFELWGTDNGEDTATRLLASPEFAWSIEELTWSGEPIAEFCEGWINQCVYWAEGLLEETATSALDLFDWTTADDSEQIYYSVGADAGARSVLTVKTVRDHIRNPARFL